jgi:hypothetical protein
MCRDVAVIHNDIHRLICLDKSAGRHRRVLKGWRREGIKLPWWQEIIEHFSALKRQLVESLINPGFITCSQLISLVQKHWQAGAIADVIVVTEQLFPFRNGARCHEDRNQAPRPPRDGTHLKNLPGHVAGLIVGIVHRAPWAVMI